MAIIKKDYNGIHIQGTYERSFYQGEGLANIPAEDGSTVEIELNQVLMPPENNRTFFIKTLEVFNVSGEPSYESFTGLKSDGKSIPFVETPMESANGEVGKINFQEMFGTLLEAKESISLDVENYEDADGNLATESKTVIVQVRGYYIDHL
ncbi:hypothetical protein ACKXGF_07565 [Alkalibacillus sp. S2W]|uniref:hypothetical protein n=1 Tax=Alkalibacillus sp. S2W TaxID=3386553 RepID=UPI00398D2C28